MRLLNDGGYTNDAAVLARGLVKQATNSQAVMYFKWRKGKKTIALGKMTLRGTTFSGHPTKTTLGNTMRQIMYISYVAKKCGLDLSGLKANP